MHPSKWKSQNIRRVGAAYIAAMVLASAAVAGTITPAAADPGEAMLASFENPSDIAGIASDDASHDHFALTADGAIDGSVALHMWSAASGGPSQISYHLAANTTFQPTPWGTYAGFAADIVNASDHEQTVMVTFTDTAGHSASANFLIPALSYGTTNFSKAYVTNRGVDVSHISTIGYALVRSTAGSTDLYVDSLRLVNSFTYDLDTRAARVKPLLDGAMHSRLQSLRTSITRDAGSIRHPDSPAWPVDQALAQRAPDLKNQIAATDTTIDPAQTQSDMLAAAKQVASLVNAGQRFGAQVASAPSIPRVSFGLLNADSADLVYPNDLPCPCTADKPALELARNESQSRQVVVTAPVTELSDVTAKVIRVTDDSGNVVGNSILRTSIAPLGFVNVKPSGSYSYSYMYAGWIPDPIRTDLSSVDVTANTFQPFWFTATATGATPPGEYRARVEIAAGGQSLRTTVLVRVAHVTISRQNELPTAFTTHPDQYAKNTYHLTDPNQVRAMVRQAYSLLGDYRIMPDNIYAGYLTGNYAHNPQNGPGVSDLVWLNQHGLLQHFNAFYVDPRTFDVNHPDTWDPQIAKLISDMKASMDVYTAAGLRDKAYFYGFDEATAQWRPLIIKITTAIKQAFPDIPIMSTLRDGTFGAATGLKGLVDIWVPQMEAYDRAAADAARAQGETVYWYHAISTHSPYTNWFNGYPPMDSRMLMGSMAYTEHTQGFLYYNIDRWVDTSTLGPSIYSSWNPATFDTTDGDGSLYYPGQTGPVASQRMANVRDGEQDYNLMTTLSKAIPDLSGRDKTTAQQLLEAHTLTISTTEHTESSQRLRQWRHAALKLLSRSHPN